jgi:DNA-binding beta-propeller fold protein YncE/4-amino-4-deoxy-L-arabinose transferase-like glycosyltransferase
MSESTHNLDLNQQILERGLRPPASLPQRRTLDRLAWALGALALGWIAQELFARDQLWPGLLLYALAIPIFAAQLATPRRDEPRRPALTPRLLSLKIAPGIRGQLGAAGMAAALVLSGLSWQLFGLETQSIAGWVTYLGSLLLFGLGVWLAEALPPLPARQQTENRDSFVSRLSLRPDLWLIAILLLALFMRLFHFFSLPFGTWYDEATAGLEARRIVQDPAFRPVFSVAMNQVAHHLYLFALSLRLLGDNIASLRAVSVLFGVGAVIAAYLFGREYAGRRWGLLLAFLVACMRWHVNFSRIAMNGVDVTFFEFLTAYFGLRAVRGRPGPLRAMAWLGLSVGLGLCFYTPFRLFVVASALFGLVMLAGHYRARRNAGLPAAPWGADDETRKWTRQGLAMSLVLLLVAAWLAAMPVTQYAWRNGQAFWGRAQHVSILQNRDEPNLARALAQNAQKHLLMFNYKGDNNGRHNLPGAPTLDRLSAILFALGLGLAVARRDRLSIFFLCLLVMGLMGGILTLDFEAPQSLRSIGALPGVIYFVALSLDALWLELRWAARITRPRYSLGLVIVVLGGIAFSNGFTYFGPQAHDPRVWMDFSTAETLVGKRMAELGPEPIYYTSPFFFDHACVRFHAPSVSPRSLRKVMSLTDPLPAREPPDRPVVYFIHPDEEWVLSLARQIYPTAQFETLPAGSEYPPAAFVVYLEPEDVASVQGLETRYWGGDEWDGAPQNHARSATVDLGWPAGAPLDLPFVAEWYGVLYAPNYGQYTLGLAAPGHVELTLDGETVEGSGDLAMAQLLASGNHDLRLRASGGRGQVRLWWQPPNGATETVPTWALYSYPVTGNGLVGKYYANPDWQGDPTMERIDPILNAYFHLTPLPRPYSVEWTGILDVPESGIYRLGLNAVDQAQLYLDGQRVVETTAPDAYTEELLGLKAGPHDLRITFQDLTGRSRIHLYWTRPNGEHEIIPSAYLRPRQFSTQTPPPTPPPPVYNLPPMELRWQATWGGSGDEPGQFTEPRDVAVIGDTVFVADTGNRRVQALGRDGAFQNALTGAEEPFEEPLALGVDGQDQLLVLDSPGGWIYRFDSDGRSLGRIGGPTIQAYHPRGMTILRDDTLVVADTGGSRLLFLDPRGDVKRQIGGVGQALIQFGEPTDVAVDGSGIYYVVEAYNQRLQRVDSEGRGLSLWPIPPSIAHDGPHLAWAPDGSLLVTAPEEGAIQRYTPDGRLLNNWTQAGPTPLCRPVGIYVDDASRTLYVTDTGCHYVHVFELD